MNVTIIFSQIWRINDIEMYLMHNGGKSVATERFVTNLKIKAFKHMTTISKNVYFDVLDNIIKKYHYTLHRTMKTNQLMLHLILMMNTILL